MSALRELMLKILLKKEVDVMAVVYATLIIKGKKPLTRFLQSCGMRSSRF